MRYVEVFAKFFQKDSRTLYWELPTKSKTVRDKPERKDDYVRLKLQRTNTNIEIYYTPVSVS